MVPCAPGVAHVPPRVEHSTQHPKPNRRVKEKSKGQGLLQLKVKASFLQRNTPHLPLPPRSSESKLPDSCRTKSSSGSPLSPERPLFLAGRADTAGPGQGLPGLTKPTCQVPGLAPPHAPELPAGGLPAWEGCRARPQVAGMGQELAREPQDRHSRTLQSDTECGEAGRWAPWQCQHPHLTPRISAPTRQPGVATGHLV